jgi:hypothetical protein
MACNHGCVRLSESSTATVQISRRRLLVVGWYFLWLVFANSSSLRAVPRRIYTVCGRLINGLEYQLSRASGQPASCSIIDWLPASGARASPRMRGNLHWLCFSRARPEKEILGRFCQNAPSAGNVIAQCDGGRDSAVRPWVQSGELSYTLRIKIIHTIPVSHWRGRE